MSLNVQVFMADLENGIDLLDDIAWEARQKKIEDEFDASLWSPPCSTFSAVRELPGGPPPLRGAAGPDLYGFAHLVGPEKEQVRIGTLCACRAAA